MNDKKTKKYISIFGSYKPTPDDEEYKAAYKTAYKLSKDGFMIINGGGSGIMAASSLGARDAGGKSIGYLLNNLSRNPEQLPNNKIIVCDSLFERLQKLTENSSAFILFSGGTGTLAELSLTWELINKGFLKKKPIICYKDFWRPVIDNLCDTSYIKKGCVELIQFAYSVEEIVSMIV